MLNRRQMYLQCYGGPAGAADSSRVLVDDLLTNMFFDVNLNAMLRLRYVIRSRCASLLNCAHHLSSILADTANANALICRAWWMLAP